MTSEEAFAEAYEIWDIETLFKDLVNTEQIRKKQTKDFKPAAKAAILGKLCGYTHRQTAKKSGYTNGTLRRALSDEVYRVLEELLRLDEAVDWETADLPQLLKQYKKTSQQSSDIDIAHIRQQLRDRCDQLLQQQKKLTTNDIMRRDGLDFGINQLFVGLGLVQRRKRSKHQDILSTEQGSKLYTPTETEITQQFKHQQFLDEVIRDRQTPKSQGQRIAIIGEPGAGKTTLLQKIGEELQKNHTVPIWVSLNRLGDKPLNQYLLEDWLPDAAQTLGNAPSEWKTALEEFLKTDEVCLLLDGVDEMTVAERSPLQYISEQLQAGWVNSIRVILTCRVNLWETCFVEGFDAYRTLNFVYPTQVEQFIDKFFIKSEKSQVSGNQLKIELQAENKARIQDLVKNPLRLSLLCYVWEIGERTLPETKAELYQWFVDIFYKLHQRKYPGLRVSPPKQQELNLAMGELAKAALDSQECRFLLPQRFIESYLGHPDDENSLFWLAKQVGWLNCVGCLPVRPLEDAYAFFHPTFQEYFAALVIDDWDYFLNHVPDNLNNGTYRIFDSKWKEIILLWIGREDISQSLRDKFMWEIVRANNDFKGFYQRKYLYSISEEACREFSDCSLNHILTVYFLGDNDIDVVKVFDVEWLRFNYMNHELWLDQIQKIKEKFLEYSGFFMHIYNSVYLSKIEEEIKKPLFVFKIDTPFFEAIKFKDNESSISQFHSIFKQEVDLINNLENLNQLFLLLHDSHHPFIRGAIINRIINLCTNNLLNIKTLSQAIYKEKHIKIYSYLIWVFTEIHKNSEKLFIINTDLIQRLWKCIDLYQDNSRQIMMVLVADYFWILANHQETPVEVLKQIVQCLGKYVNNQSRTTGYICYCVMILRYCCENISLIDFYDALHS